MSATQERLKDAPTLCVTELEEPESYTFYATAHPPRKSSETFNRFAWLPRRGAVLDGSFLLLS